MFVVDFFEVIIGTVLSFFSEYVAGILEDALAGLFCPVED